MKILILTQNESIFLPWALDYFLRRIPEFVSKVHCVVFDASPYGEKKNFISKIISAVHVFGIKFVLRYGTQALFNKIKKYSVAEILNKHNIPIIYVEGSINSNSSLERLMQIEPDLMISIAGNQIFKRKLIDIPPLGVLNLHTALLPKYRGLMPSFWVLKNRERKTGVSVFFVDEGIDSGPILIQKEILISDINQWELIRMTKFLGMEAIIESIELINKGDYQLIPNNSNEASYNSFPTKDDVKFFRKNGGRFF